MNIPDSANTLPSTIDSSRLKGIIFDYGGTLDSGGDHWSEVIWEAWQKVGVPASKEEFREAYVWAERELARVRHIYPEHDFHDLMRVKLRLELEHLLDERRASGGDCAELEVELSRWAEEAAAYCYHAAESWVWQARPVLASLRRRWPLVLVSNFYGNVETVLTDFRLRSYFDSVIESAVVGVRKPDPAIFSLGVKALGVSPEEVLVVGDSLRKDILPAESLGCQTAWLKGKGWTPEEDAQEHPSQIGSLTDLLQL